MFTGDLVNYKNMETAELQHRCVQRNGHEPERKQHAKDVIGMLNVTPLKGLMLSSSFILGTGHAQSDSPHGAFKTGDNYKRNRWAGGFELKTSPLYVRSEYMMEGNDGGIHSHGYYADFEAHVPPKFDIVADYDYLKEQRPRFGSVVRTYMAGFQYWLQTLLHPVTICAHQPKVGETSPTHGLHNSNRVLRQRKGVKNVKQLKISSERHHPVVLHFFFLYVYTDYLLSVT